MRCRTAFTHVGVQTWITCFSRHDENMALSGADDMKLKLWDLRTLPVPALTQTHREVHEAGVTSMCFSPTSPHLVATGSYDEQVRIWDMRAFDKPLSTTSGDLLPTPKQFGAVCRLHFPPVSWFDC